ncbi:hypothetical protein [Sphaerochaeta sp.]|uniref:hypothetical protein n=1 Tax=Sphaerochaeta sp. TaxID=1972642 RepID=UPI002FC83184
MKRNAMKKTLAVLVMVMLGFSLFAQNTSSGSVKLTAAYGTGFEAKLDAAYQVKIPMLVGDGALFSGNNLKVKAGLGLSPIAGTFTLDAVLTPMAVFEFSLGGGVGTGWDFDLMSLNGLKIASGGIGSPLASDSLGGLYYLGKAGAAFQFDTGAVFKGDWMSVVIRSYQELNYKGYSAADASIAWEYENGGSMVNGFNYKGEYVLGYQMPLMVNFVGLQLETYRYDLFGTKSDLVGDLSILANTQINDQFSVLTAIQLTNYVKETDTTRVITKVDPKFKRVALIASYAF